MNNTDWFLQILFSPAVDQWRLSIGPTPAQNLEALSNWIQSIEVQKRSSQMPDLITVTLIEIKGHVWYGDLEKESVRALIHAGWETSESDSKELHLFRRISSGLRD